jgi:hypothetical protein
MGIFGLKRDEVVGEKCHNKELCKLYFSHNIVVMKSKRLR